MGLHIIFAPDPALVVKNSYAGQVLYSLSTFFIKMSLLALYRRLFPTAMMKTGTVIIGLLVFGYSGALIGVDLTRCIPMQKLWNPDLDGWCMDTFIPFTVLAYVFLLPTKVIRRMGKLLTRVLPSVANVVTDILILALPIRPVSKLNLDRSRKLSVLGVFLTGGIVCIFGIIRCWAVTQASATDPTWDNVQGGIWSDVEVTVGLVCASLPTYRPLFSRRVRETNFPLSYRTAKSTKGNLQIYGGKSIQLATRMSGRRTWTRVEADQDEQSFQRLSDTTLEHIPEGVIKVRHELHQY